MGQKLQHLEIIPLPLRKRNSLSITSKDTRNSIPKISHSPLKKNPLEITIYSSLLIVSQLFAGKYRMFWLDIMPSTRTTPIRTMPHPSKYLSRIGILIPLMKQIITKLTHNYHVCLFVLFVCLLGWNHFANLSLL